MTAFAGQDVETAAFLDPWAVWDHQMPCLQRDKHGPDCEGHPLWEPHPAQLAIAEDRTRHRVICGGRRLGKSNFGAFELLLCVFLAYPLRHDLKASGKRREYWIVGPEYSDGEKEFRVFWNLLDRLGIEMDKPGSYNLPLSGQMHVSLFDGTFQVHVKSAKDPDRLVGEELTGVIMAEAAKMKPIIWTKYIRPMLLDQKGWSIHTSTPEGRNHFYDKYLRGQKASDPDWASWRVPSWFNTHIFDSPTRSADVNKLLDLSRDNPTVPVHDIAAAYDFTIHPEILDVMAELTVEAFKQEIGADFTEFVGRVFKDFDTEYHCGTLQFQPGWETFACADYGFRNPNVWLLGQIGPNDEINFLEEIYIEGYTPLEFAREIRRRQLNPATLTYFYPDPSRPDTTAVLEEELMVKSHGDTGGEVKTRLDLIRKTLKRGMVDNHGVYKDSKEKDRKWRPQMMFDWKCPRTIGDFEVYKYADKKDEQQETSTDRFENPMKLRDHGPEAVGRFMQGRFGLKAMAGQAAETKVSKMTLAPRRDADSGPIRQRARNQPVKPDRYMRLTTHEPEGYEYKIDKDDIEELSIRAYYDDADT